jgi:hypothetical protein
VTYYGGHQQCDVGTGVARVWLCDEVVGDVTEHRVICVIRRGTLKGLSAHGIGIIKSDTL